MSELFELRFERKPIGSIERAFAQFFVEERSRKKLEICTNRVRMQGAPHELNRALVLMRRCNSDEQLWRAKLLQLEAQTQQLANSTTRARGAQDSQLPQELLNRRRGYIPLRCRECTLVRPFAAHEFNGVNHASTLTG